MRAILEEKEKLRNQLEIQQTISRNKNMEIMKTQGSYTLCTYVSLLSFFVYIITTHMHNNRNSKEKRRYLKTNDSHVT